jgi:hypothetical protein
MKMQRECFASWATCLLMVLCAGALWATAPMAAADDDDGTGFDPGDTRGWQETHRLDFGWTGTQLESHPDYVEDFGFDACIGCHVLEGEGYVNEFAPGCLSCHGAEWDEDELLAIAPVLSDGAALHTSMFGWLDPRKQHQDFVDRQGVSDCTGCHGLDGSEDLEWGGKQSQSSFDAPGCLTCHGKEWDGRDDFCSTRPDPRAELRCRVIVWILRHRD